MITWCEGDIFESGADVLVSPTNCVGVQGKGLALEFKNRFPEMDREYTKMCKRGEIIIGKMFIWLPDYAGLPVIICFPTKTHYKYPSELKWIDKGMFNLVGLASSESIAPWPIKSI